MLGIVSYKDLKYYDEIFGKYQRIRPPRPNVNINTTEFLACLPGPPRRTCQQVGYHWYFMLLGNLNNETPALRQVLDNYYYLNKRTRNVRFFVPGFIVDKQGIVANQTTTHDHKEFFTFLEDGFLETIDWLEDGSQSYEYSENLELVLLPFSKSGISNDENYDFQHMLHYDLDKMLTEGKNIIQFIRSATKIVSQNMSYSETQRHMDEINNSLKVNDTKKIFIAGSKKLSIERDGIRAVFSKLTNKEKILFETKTYEDFERSFVEGGRQSDYNRYIQDEADYAIFILDNKVGGITFDEFMVAMEGFVNNGHPNIYVYCKLGDGIYDSREYMYIKSCINQYKQYFTDYSDLENLKNEVFADFVNLLI